MKPSTFSPTLFLIAFFAAGLFSDVSFAEKPNVLFIAIDDLNDNVGCLGHPIAKTPNMDRLAKRGMLFTNAHTQAPLCNPSRTSFLTGLRPSTTGVYALDPWFRTSEPLKNLETLPQHFMRNGYSVITCGKIFHDAYPPKEGRVDGVEFSVWGPHGEMKKPAKKFVDTPSKIPLMDWGAWPERDEDCFDYDLATWASDQLKTMSKEKPWMLCVGFRHPHVPCFAPQKWFDLYPDNDSVLPQVKMDDRDDVPFFAWYLHWKVPEPRLAWLQKNSEWRPLVRAYLASVSFVDAQVGRVLDALDANGQGSNTIVVLLSDHGWHLGEKLITGKNTLWERSTRVPLIFAGPGVSVGKCARTAELLDVFPTLNDLCALPKKSELEGHSLVAQLKDADAPREFPAITTHGPDNHTIRTERWRYIRYANGEEELYDMKRDPNEWTNLAGSAEFSATKKELAKWLPKINAAPVPGSKTRLLEKRADTWFWEGEKITPGDPVPD